MTDIATGGVLVIWEKFSARLLVVGAAFISRLLMERVVELGGEVLGGGSCAMLGFATISLEGASTVRLKSMYFVGLNVLDSRR